MRTQTIPVSQFSSQQIDTLYRLMSKYYEGFSESEFRTDLAKKNDIILLLDPTKIIVGFSTIEIKPMPDDQGNTIVAIFSGDTVLEKNYWGNGALGIAFVSYVFKVRCKNLDKCVYWFLMSKGYKTYLLMANNSFCHYPRFEKSTPAKQQKLIDDFYSHRFGTRYSSDTGIVKAVGVCCHLREGTAEIKPEYLSIPRVNFFQQKNPNWKSGDELACIARVSLLIPFRYFFKRLVLKRRKL